MNEYAPSPLTPDEVARHRGALVLDFGTGWCGHCARARPLIEAALQAHPAIDHQRIEDGPGRRLGRHFGVKLWPTLIFLRDGVEVARCVRPQQADEINAALAQLESTG